MTRMGLDKLEKMQMTKCNLIQIVELRVSSYQSAESTVYANVVAQISIKERNNHAIYKKYDSAAGHSYFYR